jgi:hypothetical protein
MNIRRGFSFYFGPRMALVDFMLGLASTVILFFLLRQESNPIVGLLCKDGTALYGAFLGAFAALLGFAIAVIAIVTGLVNGRQFAELGGSRHYATFWLAFVWTIRFLGAGTLLSLVAIFANQYDGLRIETLFVVGAAILASTSSLWRSGYSLELVLKAARRGSS